LLGTSERKLVTRVSVLAICTLRRRRVARVFIASRVSTAAGPLLFIRVIVEGVLEILAVNGIAGVVAGGERLRAIPVKICSRDEASECQEMKGKEHNEWTDK
jgi:hypothetical protein